MKDFYASKSVFDVVGLGAVVFHVGLTHPQTRFYPLFLATLDPGSGNRSLLSLGLRKFPKPKDNQTSVGLHNHALVETIGIEPILGDPCSPLSSQRPIPI